jgi:hypothetical protein
MPLRIITDHKVNGLNDAIEIAAHEAKPGGAPARYDIIGYGERIPNIGPRPFGVNLKFQDGPIQSETDFNGITNEALLAVVIDRMRGFQSGQFKCRENAIALTHLEEALMWLQKRTRDRMARGVEGTLTP